LIAGTGAGVRLNFFSTELAVDSEFFSSLFCFLSDFSLDVSSDLSSEDFWELPLDSLGDFGDRPEVDASREPGGVVLDVELGPEEDPAAIAYDTVPEVDIILQKLDREAHTNISYRDEGERRGGGEGGAKITHTLILVFW
jgi:hypothetical protein